MINNDIKNLTPREVKQLTLRELELRQRFKQLPRRIYRCNLLIY